MSAVDDDTALASHYESSATLLSSESTSLYSSSNGDVMTGPPPASGHIDLSMPKPKPPGVRQRITVVCAECKRLKLKCDRRTPCHSCLKRDSVDKCIYHQAASEKIDLQNLNNRLITLERSVRYEPAKPDGKPTGAINPGVAASAKHRKQFANGGSNSRPSIALALGAHNASVAINLEGPTGLWIGDLGFDMSTADAPVDGRSETSGISLHPATSVPDAGLLDFLSNFTQYFRITPNSGVEDEFNQPEGDGRRNCIGVTPQAVFKLPPPHIRAQIYPRLEAAHVMSPCVNYFHFRRRMESMFLWAEVASGLNSGETRAAALWGDDEDLPPMKTAPTMSFYAAAASALAMGAICWLFERDMGWITEGSLSSGATATPGVSSDQTSPAPAPGMASSSMPPPNVASESRQRNNTHTAPLPPVMISDALPYTLYRIAKLALHLNTERAGYQSLDLDYVYAKTVMARLFLLAHSGPTDSDYSLLTSSPSRKTIKPKKITKSKNRPSVGPSTSSASNVDSSMSEDTGPGLSRKAKDNPQGNERQPTLALDPELFGLVGEVVNTARLMGLGVDPDIVGDNKLTLYEKEMRRRLWWEVVSIDSFVADALGQLPLIQECSTRLPADVDEEAFGPESKTLPSPNIESLHGNIEYYIRKLSLLQINKDIRRRMDAIRHVNPGMTSREELDHLLTLLEDVKEWSADIPEYLQFRDNTLSITQPLGELRMNDLDRPGSPSSPDGMSVNSPTAHENAGFSNKTSPFVIAMQCDLDISAKYSILRAVIPVVCKHREGESGEVERVNAFHLIDPATDIISTWTYLHSIFKHIRPSMFMCYSFTRNLFDSSVTLAHLTLKQPVLAGGTTPLLQRAIDVLNDPSVLTGRPSAANAKNYPSEAVKIMEALLQKIENLRFGPNALLGISKRKHEAIDASLVHLNDFRLPYVGPGVICRTPNATGGTFVAPQDPPDSVSNGSGVSRKEPSRSGRAKKSPTMKDTSSAPTEKGSPAVKQKSTTNGQVTVRRRVTKKPDSGRARTGSISASGFDRAPSTVAPPTSLPTPPQPGPQIVPTHAHPPQPQPQPQPPLHQHQPPQDVSPVYFQQASPVSNSAVDNYTLPSHSSSHPDLVPTANYRSDNMYPTSMPYSHAQAYAEHHRVHLPVLTQPQHGQVNYEGFPGSSSVSTTSPTQVRSNQSFATSAPPMNYPVAAQHQTDLDLIGRTSPLYPRHSSPNAYPAITDASSPDGHYQGRGSIDHGPPAAQNIAMQTPPHHQYPRQVQAMPTRENAQAWSDNPTYPGWTYQSS